MPAEVRRRIELYHHLLMLRSKLTFDQLVGDSIQYGADQSTVQTRPDEFGWSSALCSNHVMRSGRHFAHFTALDTDETVGVVRPVQINMIDFDDDACEFSPRMTRLREYLRGKQTDRWNDSNVHCCGVYTNGEVFWEDWTHEQEVTRNEGFHVDSPCALLLDLDDGTLAVYQSGRSLGVLKDGLSGEYCWYATIYGFADPITMKRGLAPNG